MKKLLFLLLLASSATVNAQENDTLTIIKPQKVDIITGDSIQKIKVYGKEGNEKYTYESTIQLVDSNYISSVDINKDSWNFDFAKRYSKDMGYPLERKEWSTRPGFGLCQAAGAKFNGSTSVGSSWEIMWIISEWERYAYGSRHGYSIGFGIDWRNFRIDDRHYFKKLDDGTIIEGEHPAGFDPEFSRFKVFSLNIPIMWRYRGNKVSFGLGPVINFNTYASIKNRYHDADGKKQKDLYKHIHQSPVTVDIMGEVNIHNWFSLYVKYSPMNMLRSPYGDDVNFQPLSFGVIL